MTEDDLPTLDELREAIKEVLDSNEIGSLADTELTTAIVAAADKLFLTEESVYPSDVVTTINGGHNLYHSGSLEGEEL